MWNSVRTTFVAVLLLVALATSGYMVTATTDDPPEPTREQRPPSDEANFTVVPDDQQSRQPGTTGATYAMLSRGKGPWDGSAGLEKIDFYKITSQQANFADCEANNARAFGIDRNNDDPGTKTDDNLLDHMEDNEIGDHFITVEIYEEDDLGGDPTYLNDTDETVAVLADCVENEGPEGWYQYTGYVNGTNYEGQFQEVTLYSEYFYLCDCENREEAEEQLGPPPYSDESTPAEDPETETPTEDPETETPTETADQQEESESTAVATATESPERGGTTATDAPREDPATGTATADTSDETTATADSDDSRSTATRAPATAGNDDVVTPTIAEGPGLGAVPALIALVVLALLARRC